jgi:hypothetical protein
LSDKQTSGGWWCCAAEFGEHEPTCANYPGNGKHKLIELPCFGIKITLTGQGGGGISSDLHDDDEDHVGCAMADAIESLILAHACAGVDVTAPAYVAGIETSMEACENHL